ncbi:NAD dependent epimerase/dehydratase family enzyme [Leifsonia psychrotolerans]|uniref:NAD dependent epimerase/dehydratase family enzyme n=1 Tax=Glaciibacter psychrotolerans TaxID=670054 RepID=A0A7Z0EDD4_9MICO|nr:NAD dependent epimerase/dehydratase family enzyme [Leifsonia psychrotolerans]
MMASLRRAVGASFGLPMPRWMLEIGSVAIRTETELVLKSRWVLPDRVLRDGYIFAHPDLEPALVDIVHTRNLPNTPVSS